MNRKEFMVHLIEWQPKILLFNQMINTFIVNLILLNKEKLLNISKANNIINGYDIITIKINEIKIFKFKVEEFKVQSIRLGLNNIIFNEVVIRLDNSIALLITNHDQLNESIKILKNSIKILT